MCMRGITASMIAEAIRQADSRKAAPGGALACEKKIENGILRVICKRLGDKEAYLVLTAYYR